MMNASWPFFGHDTGVGCWATGCGVSAPAGGRDVASRIPAFSAAWEKVRVGLPFGRFRFVQDGKGESGKEPRAKVGRTLSVRPDSGHNRAGRPGKRPWRCARTSRGCCSHYNQNHGEKSRRFRVPKAASSRRTPKARAHGRAPLPPHPLIRKSANPLIRPFAYSQIHKSAHSPIRSFP